MGVDYTMKTQCISTRIHYNLTMRIQYNLNMRIHKTHKRIHKSIHKLIRKVFTSVDIYIFCTMVELTLEAMNRETEKIRLCQTTVPKTAPG